MSNSELEDSGESMVPEEVRLFVCDRVRSVEGLEVLRRTASPPLRSWSASELAQDLYLGEDSVDDAIETLVESGLLSRAAPGSVPPPASSAASLEAARLPHTRDENRFVYQPASDRFDEIVNLSLEVYHDQPSAVVQCLTTRAMSRVRVSLIRLTERLLDRARF